MKNIGVLLLLVSSLALANDSYNIIETRVENKATMQDLANLSDYKADYDIDISGDQMNFEIELEGVREPDLVYSDIVDSIIELVEVEAPDVNGVYITIKFDPMFGEETILYSDTTFIQ